MPAATTEYVDVNVVLTGAAAEKFSFGTLLGVFDHSVGSDRQQGPFSEPAEAVAAGFTSVAEPEVYAWVNSALGQDDGVDAVLIGKEEAGDANITATLDAVEAFDPHSWYISTLETRTEADILLAAA